MDSKKPKSQLISDSIAPPANMAGLDATQLGKQFSKLDVNSSARPATKDPSTSTSRRPEPSLQPSSRTQAGTVIHGSDRSARQSMASPTKSRATMSRAGQTSVPSSSRQPTERGQSTIGQKTTNQTLPNKTARVKTENYQVGNMQRTYLEGMVSKSKYDVPSSKAQKSYPATQPTIGQKTTNQTLPNKTARVKTEHYQVGNMQRTYLEGMVSKSKYDVPSSKAQKSYPATQRPLGRSMAPSTAKSILVNPDDISMASRQTQIASLAPLEKAKQEEWAQSMLQRNGSCPQGFAWTRIADGYQCQGSHHIISDELLQEGRGGMWAVMDGSKPFDDRLGPYYAEASKPNVFLYAGPQPKPRHAPPFIADAGSMMGQLGSQMNGPRGLGPLGSRMSLGPQRHPSSFHNSQYGSRFGPGSRF